MAPRGFVVRSDQRERTVVVSRRSRQLKRAFDIEVSESKLKGLGGRARRAAVEAATRKLERGVSAETQRQVEAEEERVAGILANRKQAAERDRERKRADKEKKEKSRSTRTACTCRKPKLDRSGKCTRCHTKPGSVPRRGLFG